MFVCLFVCLFVCWNKTRKTIIRLLEQNPENYNPKTIIRQGNASITIAQWRRARDLTNLGYPQVPGSIPAENPSTQINMDLSK